MFDLTSAVVLGLIVMGLIALAKTLVDGPNRDRLIVGVCFAISFVSVMLIAASDFAHESVVLKRELDTMNFWSQLVVVVLTTGIATGIWKGVKAITNIGETVNGGKQP